MYPSVKDLIEKASELVGFKPAPRKKSSLSSSSSSPLILPKLGNSLEIDELKKKVKDELREGATNKLRNLGKLKENLKLYLEQCETRLGELDKKMLEKRYGKISENSNYVTLVSTKTILFPFPMKNTHFMKR